MSGSDGRCFPMTQSHHLRSGAAGFTALELLLAAAIAVTILALSIPSGAGALDHIRTAMAARYLQGRIMDARLEAIRRSTRVGLRFEAQDGDYGLAQYLDGNGNGIRTTDIAAGVDREMVERHRLRDQFPGASFGLLAETPDVDGAVSSSGDGVRVGASRILTLAPDGTATPGTLYVHGRRAQFAVRVLGATGRTRLLHYDAGGRRWVLR